MRVVLGSWWVLYRVARNRLRLSTGKTFSLLFFPLFLCVIVLQVVNQATLQKSILLRQIEGGPTGLLLAAGQAAAVFCMDVLGLLLLVPAGMIRADGIAGRQRAAVDTELWLTLPLSGRQQLAARFAQATFFMSFVALFFISHFIGPALAFTHGTRDGVIFFFILAISAGLFVFGGGIAIYAFARRYLKPSAQGRLVTWSGMGMLPVLFASFAFTSHVQGRATRYLTLAFSDTALAQVFTAIYKGELQRALFEGGVILLPAILLTLFGALAVEALGNQAVDDMMPLGGEQRFPTKANESRRLSYLAKDLRLRWRDPIHRGAFLFSLLTSGSVLLIRGLSQGPLIEALHRGVADGPAVLVVAFFCGITTLFAASQWLPLEARALEFLRISGIEPPWLVIHKGLCAMIEVLVLCVPPCATLVVIGGPRLLPPVIECILLSLGVSWFVIGDSALRFPESRRSTRPFQPRTFIAAYTIIVCGGTAIVYSHSAAIAALLIIAMGALGRIDAGIDAMVYLDDVVDRPQRVRFADAWLAGALAAVVQGLSAVLIIALAHRWNRQPPLLLAVMVAYSLSALVLGVWAYVYLSRRKETAQLLSPPKGGSKDYLLGLALGALSAGIAALYLVVMRRYFPGFPVMAAGEAPLSARLVTAFVLVFVDPLAEELFFRGWILRGLTERLGRKNLALVLQAVLFAALHPTMSYLPVGILGLLSGIAVRRTGSLLPAILVHGVHNALPALLLCLGKSG